MSKVIEEKKKTKYNNILSSAFDLFAESGTMSVPIDDIVKKAGVAKGTFYLYFKDRKDLVAKIILEKASDYLKQNSKWNTLQKNDNLKNYIEFYIDSVIDFLLSDKTLTALIDKNMHICVNAVIEYHEGALKDAYNMIINDFTERGFSKTEIQLKLYIFLNMVISSCCNAILRGEPYTMDEIKPYLYNIVISNCITKEIEA